MPGMLLALILNHPGQQDVCATASRAAGGHPSGMKIRARARAALPRALRCPRRGLTPRRPATRRGTVVQAFSHAVAAIYRPASREGGARRLASRTRSPGLASDARPGLRLGAVGHPARLLARATGNRRAAAPIRVGGRRPGPRGVADWSGVASRRRIEPCVRFSRTRLSDIVHRLAYASVGFTVPVRR